MEEDGKPGEDLSRRQDEGATPEKSGHDDEQGTKGVENKVGYIAPFQLTLTESIHIYVCLSHLKLFIFVQSH